MKLFSVLLLCSIPSFFVSTRAFPSESPALFTKIFSAALPKSELNREKLEEVNQAEEQKTQASGSLLPTLQFIGTETFQDRPSSALGQSISPSTQTTARLNVKQNLFRGTSEYALYRRANRFLDQKNMEVVVQKRSLYLNLASRYISIALNELEAKRLDDEISIYSQQTDELKKRVNIGRSRPSDLMNVQSVSAAEAARKIALDIDRKNQIRELESLTGLSLQKEVFSREFFKFSTLSSLEAYYELTKNRPEIAVALFHTSTVEEEIASYRGQHFPQLDLGGNYYLRRPGTLKDVTWDLSLNLTIPIFQGGVVQSQVREASSRYRVAQIEEERVKRETRDQLENLFTTVKEGTTQLDALQKSTDLSEKTLKKLQSDYRLGLSPLLDVLTSMRSYQEALSAYDQVYSQQILARLQLEVLARKIP